MLYIKFTPYFAIVKKVSEFWKCNKCLNKIGIIPNKYSLLTLEYSCIYFFMRKVDAILAELLIENENKILLWVLDGVGGVERDRKTELEEAKTPNLDALAEKSSLGLIDPVASGITPGSGPAHLALFGYDPIEHNIGRGVLEALGVDMELKPGDVAVRGNFCTIKDGVVVDRRAGRIPTEENIRICKMLSEEIKEIEDVKIIIKPGKEHRFVVVFRGEGLVAAVTESDPQKEGKPPAVIKPLKEDAGKLARIANRFILEVQERIGKEERANGILLRGFASLPSLTPFPLKYKIRAAGIATYPMYKGIARLVGMDVLKTGTSWEEEIETLKNHFLEYDFFYLHFKEIDKAGEDKNFEEKVKFIEKADKFVPEILKMGFSVIAITGDHSTPSVLGAHSWHPNPFLLYAPTARREGIGGFSEKRCAKGLLGRMNSLDVMPLLLAHAGRLKKFGA